LNNFKHLLVFVLIITVVNAVEESHWIELFDPETLGNHWNSTMGRVYGPQAEIRRNGKIGIPTTGMFYGEALGTGWLSSKETIEKGHDFYVNEDWNQLRIIAEGPRMRTWVNGHPVDDITREDVYQSHPKGFIGLQVHGIKGKGPFVMKFRKIRIREIKHQYQ
jgi:quinoprotein glucose dehydrogenase